MFTKSYFIHCFHLCQPCWDRFCKKILKVCDDNEKPTIQLFGLNYLNNSNSIRNLEIGQIQIPNTTIQSQLFEYQIIRINRYNSEIYCIILSLTNILVPVFPPQFI